MDHQTVLNLLYLALTWGCYGYLVKILIRNIDDLTASMYQNIQTVYDLIPLKYIKPLIAFSIWLNAALGSIPIVLELELGHNSVWANRAWWLMLALTLFSAILLHYRISTLIFHHYLPSVFPGVNPWPLLLDRSIVHLKTDLRAHPDLQAQLENRQTEAALNSQFLAQKLGYPDLDNLVNLAIVHPELHSRWLFFARLFGVLKTVDFEVALDFDQHLKRNLTSQELRRYQLHSLNSKWLAIVWLTIVAILQSAIIFL